MRRTVGKETGRRRQDYAGPFVLAFANRTSALRPHHTIRGATPSSLRPRLAGFVASLGRLRQLVGRPWVGKRQAGDGVTGRWGEGVTRERADNDRGRARPKRAHGQTRRPRRAVWVWSWLGFGLDTAGDGSVENRERWRLAGIGRSWPRGGWRRCGAPTSGVG